MSRRRTSSLAAAPQKLVRRLYEAATDWAIFLARRKTRGPVATDLNGPLLVAGFFSEPTGVGRAADLTVLALRRAGLAPQTLLMRKLLARDHSDSEGASQEGGALLLHCNPDEGVRALARMPARLWRNKVRIGYWAWELPVVPKRWKRAAGLFHEIWVPSQFVADALTAGGVQTTIRVMPHPVHLGIARPLPDKARWGLPEKGVTILAMADVRSSLTRKNLEGVAEIVRRAAPLGPHTTLVLKTLDPDPKQLARLRAVLNDQVDIKTITDPLAPEDVHSLLASADILLSPHRSEGFGLALAEACLVGTPPLATGWSGNMQFMADLPPLLIDYRLAPVTDPTGIYGGQGEVWAEPSIDDAVIKLRALAASPDLGEQLAARGAEAVMRQAGAWARDRLAETGLRRLMS